MKVTIKSSLFIFLIVGLSFSLGANLKTPATLDQKLERYFSALNDIGKFNGVIYVKRNKSDAIFKAFNLQKDPSSSLHINKSDQFDIHSVSKLMANYLIIKLEQESKINRIDSLQQYIPDFPKGDQITIEMLLNHRSGLPRDFANFSGKKIELDTRELVELIKQEPLIFIPNSDRQYSNLGYQLIYFIIGELNDSTFEQVLVEQLFLPLGMEQSGAHFFTNKNNLHNLAQNHELDDGEIIRVDNILDDETKTGRVFSTANDLMLLLDEFQNNPEANRLAQDDVVEHSGGSDGVRAHIYANLNTQTNYVLLANFDGIPFRQTLRDISAILEGKPYETPKLLNRKTIVLKSEEVKPFEGDYYFPDMNIVLQFKAEEGALRVFQDGKDQGILLPESEAVFFADPTQPESFEFIPNNEGSFEVIMGWKGVKLKGKRQLD